MAQSPLQTPTSLGLGEPVSFSLGDDGRGYVVAVLADRRRDRQSALLIIDPATGRFAPPAALAFQSFGRRLTTFTAIGAVARDRTKPAIRVRVPRRMSVPALLHHRLPLRVRSNEAGQVTVSLRVGGKSSGFGFATRDTPGAFAFSSFDVVGRERRRLRQAVGKRAQVSIGVSDLKGNRRRVVRTVRLTR